MEYKELEYIVNQSPAIVFLWKNLENWPVEFVSKNIKQFGYEPNDFISGKLKYADIIHPDDLERVSNEVVYFSKSHIVEFSQEYRILTKNGEIKWLDDRTWIRRDNQGNITHFQGIVIDVTKGKNAETKLKESEELFRKIAENTFIGLSIIQDNKIIYINEALTKINEYSLMEMKNMEPQEYLEMIQPDYRELISNQIKTYQEKNNDSASFLEFPFYSKKGTLKWVITNTKSIIYNHSPAVLTTVVDITEKKKTEEKLVESEKKYKEAYKQAELYKDIFAHDINNILQNILSGIELSYVHLENKEMSNTIGDILKRMQMEVKRGGNLVSNVRKLSQIEEKELTLKQIDIIEKLKESITTVKNIFDDRLMDIIFDPPTEKLFSRANELLIDIFINLLYNSIRYNKNPIVKIQIIISKKQKNNINYIKIEILDNGIGIEDTRKLTIFSRAESENKSVRGMGLGLSLVKKIVERFNGLIYVKDRIKGDFTKGSNFVLLIPEV